MCFEVMFFSTIFLCLFGFFFDFHLQTSAAGFSPSHLGAAFASLSFNNLPYRRAGTNGRFTAAVRATASSRSLAHKPLL